MGLNDFVLMLDSPFLKRPALWLAFLITQNKKD